MFGVVALTALLASTAPAAQDAPRGKKYALLVGVREDDHSDLGDLEFTENDAEQLAGALRGFDEVTVLTSTRGKKAARLRPTAANIRAELERLLKKVTKRDLVLVEASYDNPNHRNNYGTFAVSLVKPRK